jgi:hypothetical protein
MSSLSLPGDSMHMQARRRPIAILASVLLAAAALFALGKAHAACGEQRDFLVRQDPLLTSVRPVDCATLLDSPPQFTWPLQEGRNTYTVALRFPDGHTEQRSTTRNWLSWDHPVPAGDYSWHVSVAGAKRDSSKPRIFRIERPEARPAHAASAAAPGGTATSQSAAPSAPAAALFRVEPSESWIPVPKAAQASRKRAVGGFFGGFTE